MCEYNQVIFPRRLLKRFIELYKSERCLWDRTIPEYRLKTKKNASLLKLTRLVQEYDEYATRVHVLRKIDSLRACARREHKRVIESRVNATSPSEVYTPTLWYYELLTFLFENNEHNTQPVQNEEAEEEEEENAPSEEENSVCNDESYSIEYKFPVSEVEVDERPTSSKKRHINYDEESFKMKRAKAGTEVDDEYDAIGINVAAKLRYLPSNMRIVAEKLINDVLFQAQINGLNSSTKIVTSDPFTQ